ncbi:hypothetical protein H9P43_002384 [Blastocladiella emersonii ATCC 22665]|nr:hypothetical protein H9P43_002384 [Blastocladiella emersonii ATCC 22665]
MVTTPARAGPGRGRGFLALALAALVAALAATAVLAQSDANSVPKSLANDWVLYPLWEKLPNPTAVRFTPNGQVFITGRAGVIYYAKSVDEVRPVKVADITKEVFNNFDRGLTGLAIHPDWPKRNEIYVFYGRDGAVDGPTPLWNDICASGVCEGSNALARFQWNNDLQRLENFTNIVIDWCISSTTHQVGDLHFDKNGNLVMSAGDMTLFDNGLNFGEAPNKCKTLTNNDPETGGSMQALTVGNPIGKMVFVTKADLEAWTNDNTKKPQLRPHALGFRNPYRFAIDKETNEIYLGDVGFADWEELNLIDPIQGDSTPQDKIKNYGWPCLEGPMITLTVQNRNFKKCEAIYRDQDKETTKALFAYNHRDSFGDVINTSGGQSAITGVAVYRGDKLPANYKGSVWFLDYTRKSAWVISRKDGKLDVNSANFKMMFTGIEEGVDLTWGPDEALYVTQIWEGKVYKYQYVGKGGVAPIVRVKADKPWGALPLTVNFDGTGTVDPLRGSMTYEWDYGQGFQTGSVNGTFTFKKKEIVTVKLRVRSDKGNGVSTQEIKVFPGYEIKGDIKLSVSDYAFSVGDDVNFEVSAKKEDGSVVPNSALTWTVLIAHCYPGPVCRPNAKSCHSHLVNTFEGTNKGSFKSPDHDFPSFLTFGLDVVHPDAPDLRVTLTKYVTPKSATVKIATNPEKLFVFTNLVECAAPCPFTGLQGGALSLEVNEVQMNADRQAFRFTGWSTGGKDLKRVVTVDKNDTVITASFEPFTLPEAPADKAVAPPAQVNVVDGWRKCTVSWKPPAVEANKNAPNVTNYIVYYRESKFMQAEPKGNFKTHIVPGTTNSWDLLDVDVASICEFQVSAVTADGEGQKSPVAAFRSLLVPPVEVLDCPETKCTYKGALIDDWNRQYNPKNLMVQYQEPSGDPQQFTVRDDKLVFQADKSRLASTYWYSGITDANARCFDAYTYYTHLVFKVTAPKGADFEISLSSRPNGCKGKLDQQKFAKASKYVTFDGTEKQVMIPLADAAANPRNIYAIAFQKFNTDAEILFDDLGFINRCQDRPSSAPARLGAGLFADPKAVLTTGAGLIAGACAAAFV